MIERLLDLTLKSILGQTDARFSVLVMGHERPAMPEDPRIEFIGADWRPEPPGPHNDDGGRKKHAINDLVLARGGGLLAFVDADDWIERTFVQEARARLARSDAPGALVERGFAVDFQTLRAAPLPHPRVFGEPFHRLCGTSTVAHLRPGASDPLRRDPFSILRSHHQWAQLAGEMDVALETLPCLCAYLVNTSENHSETLGPHAQWRRALAASVNKWGRPLDVSLAQRFGLRVQDARTASARSFARRATG